MNRRRGPNQKRLRGRRGYLWPNASVDRLITDPYGRPVDNLRVSITQSCDLRCFFCHREGEPRQTPIEMTPKEIGRVVAVAAGLGVNRIKLTGGEPLLREDVVDVVYEVSHADEVKEVAMTTNGVLLAKLAQSLREAGLGRVNVSVPSLNPEVYRRVAGVDAAETVLEGVRAAVDASLWPVKVNMVVLRGLTEEKVEEMIRFTVENGLVLQLIEFESRDGSSELYHTYHVDLTPIEAMLEARAERVTVRRMQKRRKFFLRDGGEVEVVRPMHNIEFCGSCSRLRVTSDGRFKPCLFRDDNTVDFLTPMRSGASDANISRLLLEAVGKRKPYFM